MAPPQARRVRFPAIRQSEWETVEVRGPADLRPLELLLRTECTLVSAGTETAIYGGTHIGYTIPNARYPRMPFFPGYAYAGTVEATGSAVRGFQPGDRVCGTLRHQDWVVVEEGQGGLAKLPDAVTFEQGCLARLATISMQGIRLARVQLGERAVVFGQGLIGQLARQLAALDGAGTTVAVDLIDARLELARRHGATHLVNPSRDDAAAAITAATDGRGGDVVIEATGAPAVINDALRAAADLGRVVLLGSPRGRVEIDPYNDIHRRGVMVIGSHAGTTASVANPFHRWTEAEHRRVALALLEQGRLKTDGLISHHVPADECLGVWEALVTRPQDHLGVLIQWQ